MARPQAFGAATGSKRPRSELEGAGLEAESAAAEPLLPLYR